VPRASRLTIALAGGVGSGKTTVARALADRLGGHVVGFGDFVRLLASRAGKETGRSDLQRLGQERIEQDTPYFVREFLKWAAPPAQRPLIIEGVRHEAVDLALRAWAIAENREYSLILIDTAAEERAVRRTDGNLANMHAIDQHLVERETAETLSRSADAIVDGSGHGGEVLARVVKALGDRWPAGM
jgi:dephospho-CoA kinase